MQVGWCLICGSGTRLELARKAQDQAMAYVTGQAEAAVRFVVCLQCGHAYQDPMPDAEDLHRLRAEAGQGGSLWRPIPDDEYARNPAGSPWCDRDLGRWLLETVESTLCRRTLLAIGRGLADCLHPFKEGGWEVTEGISLSAWSGLSGPMPDRRFSLIVLLHTIEHLPDPIPMLQALRDRLEDDGVLFVATPNLFSPPPVRRCFDDFLSGAQVRLYSPGTLQTALARAGFQTDAVRVVAGDCRMGLIARSSDSVPDQPGDDPLAIQRLYRVLQWPGSADVLGLNLAALSETQPWVIPPLCRQAFPDEMGTRRYRVRRSNGCLVALGLHHADGHDVPIIRWGERDGHRAILLDPFHREQAESHATIVQLGLGSGELATALAERLRASQHLIIWEADPALAKAILEVVDLSSLWLSTQVSLLFGSHPYLSQDQQQRLKQPSLLYITSSARCWNIWTYRHMIGTLTPSGLTADGPQFGRPVQAEVGEGAFL